MEIARSIHQVLIYSSSFLPIPFFAPPPPHLGLTQATPSRLPAHNLSLPPSRRPRVLHLPRLVPHAPPVITAQPQPGRMWLKTQVASATMASAYDEARTIIAVAGWGGEQAERDARARARCATHGHRPQLYCAVNSAAKALKSLIEKELPSSSSLSLPSIKVVFC